MTSSATIDRGIVAFLEDYQAVLKKHVPVMGTGVTSLDTLFSELVSNSYKLMITRIVQGEVMRINKDIIIDAKYNFSITQDNLKFSLNIDNLEWEIRPISAGININVVLIENTLAANMGVATAFTALHSAIRGGNPDLLAFIKAKVNYILALIAPVNSILQEANKELK